MKTNYSLVKLAICGPGDVKKEMAIIKEVVDAWNLQHGEARGFWIKHQHWSTDSHPELGENAQSLINRQMVDDSDIIVAVFWSRFGSPTGASRSGTEEEIRRGVTLGRKVMVYFSDLEPLPANADKVQLNNLWAFRRDLKTQGLCWQFVSRQQFRNDFTAHLALKLNSFDSTSPSSVEAKLSQTITGNKNYQAGRDINVFNKPPVIKNVIERVEGSVSPEQLRQIQLWIEELAEGTVGMGRQRAYGMWGSRLKSKFKLSKREELPSARMIEVEKWFRTQCAIQTRGLRTKAPDEFRRRRITAIKVAMKKQGVVKEEYYAQLASRLKMKKIFISLTDLTKTDLQRVYNMVLRDAKEA